VEESRDDKHCLQLVAELCKDHSGVASTCDNTGTESVGAPCETRPCHQGKKRVVSCAHHDGPYNVVGKLVKPQKCELVYEPRFAKRMRQRFSLFVVGEYQKVGAVKETHRG
jgi:hypothetical protein